MEKQPAQDDTEGGAEPGFGPSLTSEPTLGQASVFGAGDRPLRLSDRAWGRDPRHLYRPLSPLRPVPCSFPGETASETGAVGPGARTESQHFPTCVLPTGSLCPC